MSVCANNFFLVQISLPYTTIRKAIAPSRWTFVAKVMSLLFNMLSSLVIAFLPRNIFNLKPLVCGLNNQLILLVYSYRAFPLTQMVTNLPAMPETRV